jgi:hypothetical protein
LTQEGITDEADGGDTFIVPMSAKTGLNVPQLLEAIQVSHYFFQNVLSNFVILSIYSLVLFIIIFIRSTFCSIVCFCGLQFTAQMMDLRADSEGAAEAMVVEARVDRGLGALANVIVDRGTLHVGDAGKSTPSLVVISLVYLFIFFIIYFYYFIFFTFSLINLFVLFFSRLI